MLLQTPTGSTIQLAYGMNVHPGGDARATIDAIQSTVLPLKKRLGVRGAFGLAVRWSAKGVAGLAPDRPIFGELVDLLKSSRLAIFTGNAFVHGEFHGEPLKDEVYRPDWTDARRLEYTLAFAEVLARLARAVRPKKAVTLSLSTSPLSWKGWSGDDRGHARSAEQLVACGRGLAEIKREYGVRIILGLEPEPGCSLETTEEVRRFFAGPLAHALRASPNAAPYLGVCYDVCHQAVQWEDGAESLQRLADDEIALAKVQASCALELPDAGDAAGRDALAAFNEPVYLHQTSARDAAGTVHMASDLGDVLDDATWHAHGAWRSHFHVPVFRREATGPLRTTQPDLEACLAQLATNPNPAWTGHLEIETYTWDVLPEAERAAGSGSDLVDALEQEYRWVLEVLAAHGVTPAKAGA